MNRFIVSTMYAREILDYIELTNDKGSTLTLHEVAIFYTLDDSNTIE